jgi:hypothetical protein
MLSTIEGLIAEAVETPIIGTTKPKRVLPNPNNIPNPIALNSTSRLRRLRIVLTGMKLSAMLHG